MLKDNYDLFVEHEREQEALVKNLPKCHVCGEHIQQDKAIRHKGKWYCENCEDAFLEEVRNDYLENIEI